MAARFSSLSTVSRSLMASARNSPLRSQPSLLRPPPLSTPRLRPPRLSFSPSRNFGELGCTQSFLPFNCAAHLSVDVQACSDLFHGTFCRSCQDR